MGNCSCPLSAKVSQKFWISQTFLCLSDSNFAQDSYPSNPGFQKYTSSTKWSSKNAPGILFGVPKHPIRHQPYLEHMRPNKLLDRTLKYIFQSPEYFSI